MLLELGHQVTEAADGAEALEFLQGNEIDVLVADIGLPDVSGVDLAAAVRRLYPNVAIVFATGEHSLPTGAPSKALLLRKPYSEMELKSAVERAWATKR
jgi:CheY-like chemotaxis protein